MTVVHRFDCTFYQLCPVLNSPNPEPISNPPKNNFPHPFSGQTSKIHTCFQTWPLGRNYVIVTKKFFKSIKWIRNFRILIVFFPSYSFGIETINTFITLCSSLKTIPDSRPKWAKCIPVFRPKRHKNSTRWGGTYLCSLSWRDYLPEIQINSSNRLWQIFSTVLAWKLFWVWLAKVDSNSPIF